MPALPHALVAPITLAFYGMGAAAVVYCAGMGWCLRQRAYGQHALYFAAAVSYVALSAGGPPGWSPLLIALVRTGSAALAVLSALRLLRAAEVEAAPKFGFASAALALLVSWLPLPESYALAQQALPALLALHMVLLALGPARAVARAQHAFATVSGALSSELAAVSEALRTAEQASQRAERATRVRDEFIATMSHEFRTPLNPIINIPQGLRMEFVRLGRAECARCSALFELEAGETVTAETACPDCSVLGSLRQSSALSFSGDAARARLLLTKVEHSGEQLLRVVNGILDFSKMEARQLKLVREHFDARALVRALLRELDEPAQRADIHLTYAGEERPLLMHADPQRVREVLAQLIDNAIKFRRGPGTVTIGLRDAGERVNFSVQDQGVGIAREHLESVFTSFEQVSKGNTRSHGGTGLGLTMARALVQMHGGEITASSELNVGTTFRFWLPKGSPRGSLRALKRLSLGAGA